MGLFGRSRAEREEVRQLRGELAAMQERLVESVRANTQLGERLRTLDSTNSTLVSEVAALRTSNAELTGRLGAVDELSAHVEDLDARLIPAPTTQPPPPPTSPPSPPPPDGVERVDGDELDELERRVSSLSESVATLDQRITNISTELANQLSELGTELDTVSERAAGGAAVDDEQLTEKVGEALGAAMGEIQDGQERLAAEQARYQIQFREDLAELADRLRRNRPT